MAKSIVARDAYKDKEGNEKVAWNPVGVLIEHNGKQYIKLNQNPGVLYHCFEIERKEDKQDGASEGNQY